MAKPEARDEAAGGAFCMPCHRHVVVAQVTRNPRSAPVWSSHKLLAGRAAHSSSGLTSHGCGYVSVHWIVLISLEVVSICAPL